MPELVGAYERIVLFLRECRRQELLDDEKHVRLLDAVEEISGGQKPIEIKWNSAEGATEGMQLLQACGIETTRRKTQSQSPTSSKKGDEKEPRAQEVKQSAILGDDKQSIFEIKAAKSVSGELLNESENRIAAETLQIWWRTRHKVRKMRLGLAAEALIIGDVRKDSADLRALLSNRNFDCYSPENMDRPLIQRAIIFGFTKPWNFNLRYQLHGPALHSWIEDISTKYLENPYHNWWHAFDVYQFIHMSADSGVMDFLNYQDVFALLIAAIAHDVGHPGFTNPYLIATKSHLAITYNDRSPLENMHASTCFETMYSSARNNFLSTLDAPTYSNLRTKIVEAILATDNKHHFEMIDKFKARVSKTDSPFERGTKEDREKQKTSKEDRRLLLQAFMHVGDIANCCRPFDAYKKVVGYLEAEFFNQGDSERDLGIPISMLMDRTKDSLAAAQGFWINNMVAPLITPWSNFLEDDYRQALKDNMDQNTKGWEALIEKYGKKTAGELLQQEGSSPRKSFLGIF